jgi:hypothetical protein
MGIFLLVYQSTAGRTFELKSTAFAPLNYLAGGFGVAEIKDKRTRTDKLNILG